MRPEPTTIERMIKSARAAVRCREEAGKDATDHETSGSLMRAADRYSRRVAELADEMLREAGL